MTTDITIPATEPAMIFKVVGPNHGARTMAAATSDWERAEIVKPQFHEAGHAVVARLNGFPVVWVSIDQKFIDVDHLAIRSECTGFGPVCMTISSDILTPMLERGFIRTKAERENVIGYVMNTMAGPMVESHIEGSEFDPGPSQRDWEQASGLLNAVEPHRPTRKKLYWVAMRRLARMVDEHWDAIVRVAAGLHRSRTLTGPEIDNLIAGRAERMAA